MYSQPAVRRAAQSRMPGALASSRQYSASSRSRPRPSSSERPSTTSPAWGETPVAYVVRKPGATAEAQSLLAWVNERVGKTQRLSALELTDALPRSAIGKVLKRELRDRFQSGAKQP